ncbi:MAG: phosphatidylserine/phosphatidylglycerophosphate/cardiolipin synthase family protein [Leptolyngbyaceae cyanobacterium]
MTAILIAIGLLSLTLVSTFGGYLYFSGHFRRQLDYGVTGLQSDSPHFVSAIASFSDSLATQGTATNFWSNIDEIQAARLALMASAQHSIQFETFTMTPGRRANDFATVLQQKASEGVVIEVLADSYGAKQLPASYWRSLTNAGVDVRFFNPFSARAPLDYLRRNHRKLLIVDQAVAMIGGAGIADRWDGKDSSHTGVPWCDFEVAWRGEVVGLLTGFFWQHWLDAGGQVDLARYQMPGSAPPEPTPMIITPGDDPSIGDSPIRSLFQLCITAATTRLWIASPYLLPDDATCQKLIALKQRGVDVRILTMGPKADKFYVYCVSRERYPALLKADIKIHEYQPSMMHGKVVLIDDLWVSLGSANLDPRSFFHNDELNVCTNAAGLLNEIEAFFKAGFAQSQLVQLPEWQQRSLKERALGQVGNFFYWQL